MIFCEYTNDESTELDIIVYCFKMFLEAHTWAFDSVVRGSSAPTYSWQNVIPVIILWRLW